MGFKVGRRRGRHWDDAQKLHRTILEHEFNTTGQNERFFEIGLASSLKTLKNGLS